MTPENGDPMRPIPTANVVVVGGANTDLVGTPNGALVAHDSNPGRVRTSPGGVGRNIAENLVRMGVATSLITAFGGDEAGRELTSACWAAGIDVGSSIVIADLPGPRYVAIIDERRDLVVAVNDMRALDRLTPEILEEGFRAEALERADLVVADANLPESSLRWLAERLTAPLVVDTVSVAKAPRLASLLPRMAAIKPSALEAGVLLGREVVGLDAARVAAEDLVSLGVGSAYVTCGPEGAAWADRTGSGTIAAPAVTVASTNGAGDAFCAGVAYALLAHGTAPEAARLGSALAAITLEDESTVCGSLSLDAALSRMDRLLG
jgi:pseudouridine kinase